MPVQCTIADYRWLIHEEALPWLLLAADGGTPLHQRTTRLRQSVSPAAAHLVLEQADLRRRARAKFTAGERLFFTATGLEQATDEWIAAYKTQRFPSGEPVADLCCGIGGDLLSLGSRGAVHGCDTSAINALLAEENARRVLPPDAQRPRISCTGAEHIDLKSYAAWHIDPDRRSTGRRTVDVQRMSPSIEVIDGLLAENPNAAVKLAPASALPQGWHGRAEFEWISRGRECRQLVAWFGNLGGSPGPRTATVLSQTGTVRGRIAGTCRPWPPPTTRPGEYLYEPDPAVLAAGLAGQVAEDYGLVPLAPDIPYLTGDQALQHGALAAFRILDVLPFDKKRLKSHLKARNVGRLEIKHRGVALQQAHLQRQWKLSGDEQAVVLITPHHGRTVAILANRLPE